MTTLELKLSRLNRIHRPSEPLEGKIIVKSTSPISHSGVRISINGSVTLQVRGGSAGVIESLYGVVKPISILQGKHAFFSVMLCLYDRNCYTRVNKWKKTVEVSPPGKIAAGTTEIPFSVALRERGDGNTEKFYETFHGADISIQYLATVGIVRGYLHKSLHATTEFIIETDKAELFDPPLSPEMVLFYITQDTQKHPLLPELRSGGFRVTGKIATQCIISDPLSGELRVEKSVVPIKSIDIHLLRMESILAGERIVTETSLIQTTQIADGDICRNLTLPIYVIFPRLMTCPTVLAGSFSVEFKVSIVITFQSELSKLHPTADPRTPRLWLAMETLPLELVRTR